MQQNRNQYPGQPPYPAQPPYPYQQQQIKPQEDINFCPYCGANILMGSNFCMECGKKIK